MIKTNSVNKYNSFLPRDLEFSPFHLSINSRISLASFEGLITYMSSLPWPTLWYKLIGLYTLSLSLQNFFLKLYIFFQENKKGVTFWTKCDPFFVRSIYLRHICGCILRIWRFWSIAFPSSITLMRSSSWSTSSSSLAMEASLANFSLCGKLAKTWPRERSKKIKTI